MTTDAPDAAAQRPALLARLLRLRHVRLSAWQRAAAGEGTLAVAALLVLADLVSAWALLVLPVVVAALVKAHDVVAGSLASPGTTTAPVPQDRRRRNGVGD